MITQNPWTDYFEFILKQSLRSLEEVYDQFNALLQAWLDDILSGPIPDDWRTRLDQLVAQIEELGLEILPGSIEHLEKLVASRVSHGKPIVSANHEASLASHDKPPALLDPIEGGKFEDRLRSAQRKLETLRQLLALVGAKLEAAKHGETVDIDSDVATIEEYLRGYNEDLEAARAIWLRYDLSSADAARLTEMLNPSSLGLPPFADEEEGKRAYRQLAAIGQRLDRHDFGLAVLETGLKGAEIVGTAAGAIATGGVVYTAAKSGGKWAVAKAIAAGAAAYGADQLAEYGLKKAGVSEQTIRGVKLAAAVVSLILLHKASKRGDSPAPATTAEEQTVTGAAGGKTPPSATPSRQTSPAGRKPPIEPPSGKPPAKPPTPPPEPPPAEPPRGTPSAKPPAPAKQSPPAVPPANKPPFPPPESNQRYKWEGHRIAAETEEAAARTIHSLPDEAVVHWGKPVTANGPDIISVNIKTGEVTLWDPKYRGSPRKIQPSSTFQTPKARDRAIEQAIKSIKANTTLSPEIRAASLKNLAEKQVKTRTVGEGKALNSTLE